MKKSFWLFGLAGVLAIVFFQNCSGFESLSNESSSIGTSESFSIVNAQGEYVLPLEAQVDPNDDLKVYLRNAETFEGSGADFKLILNRAAETDVTVSIQTFNGSGIAGTHFENVVKTITIPAGETEVIVTIPTLVFGASTEDHIFGVKIFEASVAIGQDVAGVMIIGGQTPFQLESIRSMSFHSCGLKSDGAAWCWGGNRYGSLGDGSEDDSFIPVLVNSTSKFKDIQVGHYHSCGITMDDTVECWGRNSEGQVGAGNYEPALDAKPVVGLTNVTDLALGYYSSCAVVDTGSVYCWGSNVNDQLGVNNPDLASSNTPLLVTGLVNIEKIYVAASAACAQNQNGLAYCWGSTSNQKIGIPSLTVAQVSVPQRVPLFDNAEKIVFSLSNTCFITAQKTVNCIGAKTNGLLGRDPDEFPADLSSVVEPHIIPGLSDVADLDLGRSHACALTESSEYYCWGRNSSGEAGFPLDTPFSAEPGLVGGYVENVKAISAGSDHSCYLDTNGHVRCWGNNFSSRLGNSISAVSQVPRSLTELEGYKEVVAGLFHTCGIKNDNSVDCWGQNFRDQLGNGTEEDSSFPLPVAGIVGVRSLKAANYSTCAVLADKSVRCWGSQYTPEEGENTVLIGGLDPVAEIAVGGVQGCAIIESDRSVRCWRAFNTSAPSQLEGIAVEGLSGVRRIAMGSGHTCAVLEDRTVNCWGINSNYQLGITDERPLGPQVVPGLEGVLEISASFSQTCVIRQNGVVRCWGSNRNGQLGLGTYTDRELPTTDVVGIIGAKQISMGNTHTCILTADRRARCWGNNRQGQLGNNTVDPTAIPKDVLTLLDLTGVHASTTSTYFRKADGSYRVAGVTSTRVSLPTEYPITLPK